ncbi:hypothetical protein SR39_30025 [Methylobacterium radiotolerans]|nr:hypothetical protein SR39_30025 [Methylobacterium radiotolerans]
MTDRGRFRMRDAPMPREAALLRPDAGGRRLQPLPDPAPIDEQPGRAPVAGHRHVDRLRPGSAQVGDVRLVHRHALGRVHGHGVAVLQPRHPWLAPLAEPDQRARPGAEPPPILGQPQRQHRVGRITGDRLDPGEVGVADHPATDLDALAEDDLVTHRQRQRLGPAAPARDRGDLDVVPVRQKPVAIEPVADPGVQLTDVLIPACQHRPRPPRPLRVAAAPGVGVDQRGDRGLAVLPPR